MTYVRFDRSIGLGESPYLETARLQQTALTIELTRAEANLPTREEMQRRQPELDANLAALPDDTRFVLAGIAEAIQNRSN